MDNPCAKPHAEGGGRNGWSLSAWCVIAAFGAYFCMYAFRKPFSAGFYAEPAWGEIQTKTLLVTAQTIGYALSKFIGVKVVTEMRAGRRIAWLLGLMGSAEIALLLFAVTPTPINCFFLFLNGLPLGMVFGVILSFLEGRRHTEALTAGLCCSFILAGGVMKTVGTYLLVNLGLGEAWMPFCAGLLFVPPMLVFVWMLSRIPAPSAADVAARSARAPMASTDRGAFYARYAFGLSLLMAVFLLTTILRSVRDDFAPEIWKGLGIVGDASVFSLSEGAIGVVILLLSGMMVCVPNNRVAFFGSLALSITGLTLMGLALVGLHFDALSPLGFMVLHGLGLHLPYVIFHTTVFERLIALTRDRGTIVYLMGLADAVGYLGYAVLMLFKNRFGTLENFLDFFVPLSWMVAGVGIVLLLPSWRYFAVHQATQTEPKLEAVQV